MKRFRPRDKSLTIAGFLSDLQKFKKLLLAVNRKRKISSYIASHDVRKLQIGSGRGPIAGWLSTDINPVYKDIIYLNATKKFPFPNGSFDYISCEHMIEHISRNEGLFMLRECRRVLKEGGIIRISTPDLAVLVKMYSKHTNTKIENRYIKWITDSFIEGVSVYRPSFVLNAVFRCWGHIFLYDEELLRTGLQDAGFKNITRVSVGDSTHAALRGIERHGDVINVMESEDLNKFETMVFEATSMVHDLPDRQLTQNTAELMAAE
jgi:predicted SAM-dependent methyltransferase